MVELNSAGISDKDREILEDIKVSLEKEISEVLS